MSKFTIIISIVLLIASLFLLFDKMFTPQTIQITLQSGEEVTTSSPEYFTLSQVLLMTVSAFLIGLISVYLFYNSDLTKTANTIIQAKESPVVQSQSSNIHDAIIPLLKPDEKNAFLALREAGGEMPQNKLVLTLNVSKVKATRILYSLQQKNLITKERHGLTNMVKLKK